MSLSKGSKKSKFCSVMSPFSASACPKEEEGGGRFFPLHENNCSDCWKEEGASDDDDTTLSRKKNLSSSSGGRRRTNGKERVERERRRRRRPRFHNGKLRKQRERNRDYSPPKTTSLYATHPVFPQTMRWRKKKKRFSFSIGFFSNPRQRCSLGIAKVASYVYSSSLTFVCRHRKGQ